MRKWNIFISVSIRFSGKAIHLEKGRFQKRGISLLTAALAAAHVKKAVRRGVSYREPPIISSRNTACTAETVMKIAL